jgi:hypothetical protein
MSPEVIDIVVDRIRNFGLFFSHMQASVEFSIFRFFFSLFSLSPFVFPRDAWGIWDVLPPFFFPPFGLTKIIVDCPIIESFLFPIPAFVDSLSCRFFLRSGFLFFLCGGAEEAPKFYDLRNFTSFLL